MIGRDEIAAAEAQATWEYAKEHGIDFAAAASLMRSNLAAQQDWFPNLLRDCAYSRFPFHEALEHAVAAVWAQGVVAGVIAGRNES